MPGERRVRAVRRLNHILLVEQQDGFAAEQPLHGVRHRAAKEE
jgi:hypothetical protein